MGDVQMLFPMEPKEFWQKLKAIVEQVVIEHSNGPTINTVDQHGPKPLLKVKEVCSILKISKPTLYEWMNQGRIESVKIKTRRYFKEEDIEKLIESNRSRIGNHLV